MQIISYLQKAELRNIIQSFWHDRKYWQQNFLSDYDSNFQNTTE